MSDPVAPAIPYYVEPMTVADLDAVIQIENATYSAPWPLSAYRHELEHNSMANYLVLRANEPERLAPSGMRDRLLGWLRGAGRGRSVLGYGGFWLMVGEAHISTIVVDDEWRGMGLGELMLLELIELALRLGADMVTLEVRVSNTVAQALYEKYQFEFVGKRKRYYRDNNEDAHIMTVESVQSEEYRAFLDNRWMLLRERLSRQADGRAMHNEWHSNGKQAS